MGSACSRVPEASPSSDRGTFHGNRPAGPASSSHENADAIAALGAVGDRIFWARGTTIGTSDTGAAPPPKTKTRAAKKPITAICGVPDPASAVQLLSVGRGGQLGFWTAKDPRVAPEATLFLPGHELAATAVTHLRDRTACSGGRDCRLVFWDLEKQTIADKRLRAKNVVRCLGSLEDGNLVVQGAEDLHVRIWDARVAGGEAVQTIGGYAFCPLDLSVHPTSPHYILTSSRGVDGQGGQARVIDRRQGSFVHSFPGHHQDATGCTWLGDRRFATCSKDGSVRLWCTDCDNDLPGELDTYRSAHCHTFTCMLGDSSTAWVGTSNGHLKHFEVTANQNLEVLRIVKTLDDARASQGRI